MAISKEKGKESRDCNGNVRKVEISNTKVKKN